MKLEVGMYVRTKHGIRKIIDIDEDNNYYIDKTYINDFRQEINCISDNCIIGEPSFNIIDLIEEGDYVNGSWVNEIVDGKPIHEDYNDPYYSFGWENEDIKSVITHEQMEQMAYKVGE